LYLKNDYGTNGFTQWYYFKVHNTRRDLPYRFNIVNLMKPESTYTLGMKPLVYSVKDAEKNGLGWQREGANIAYYQNAKKRRLNAQSSFN
jgi:cytosolic carboxypeptidase protein 2/3